MAATMHRQPFGELNFESSRMQGLVSQKNCQNAVTDSLHMISTNKPASKPTMPTPGKRSAILAFSDEALDSENVDPALTSPAKRSMNSSGYATKRPVLPLKTSLSHTAAKSGSALLSTLDKPTTPTSPLANKFSAGLSKTPGQAYTSTPLGGSTSAPAGRSPKHKRIGILTKKRGSLSPFRRVDPPASLKPSSAASNTGLSFSIDAALSGTLQPKPKRAPAPSPSLSKPHPKSWSFEIHEDTPQQHATNMMEHSAVTLDISGDDEAGSSVSRGEMEDDKENVPPPGHFQIHRQSAVAANGCRSKGDEPPARAGLAVVDKESLIRDASDDILARAPLGMLQAEDYYGAGLHKESLHVVPGESEDAEAEALNGDADDEFENDKENDENAKPAVEVRCDVKVAEDA